MLWAEREDLTCADSMSSANSIEALSLMEPSAIWTDKYAIREQCKGDETLGGTRETVH